LAAIRSPQVGAVVVVVDDGVAVAVGVLDGEAALEEGVVDPEGDGGAWVQAPASVTPRATPAARAARRRRWCGWLTAGTYPAWLDVAKPSVGGEARSWARTAATASSSLLQPRRARASPWQDRRMALPVVLDVDTGVDDACAILLAAMHPAVELRAVTCVGGNAPLAAVVSNTLTVLDAAQRPDVVVAAGAELPLLEDPVDARHVHGLDGMGDLDWPKSRRAPDPRHAVEVLRDVLLAAAASGDEAQRVTLVPLAPLTNIALLLRTYPAVAPGIREIVFMGGAAAEGNATASAEFNVFHDPEAAAIVLDAAADLGVSVTMYGLDVFYEPRVRRSSVQPLLDAGACDAADLAARLVAFQCERFGSDAATIGDAGAVCAVIEPGGVRRENLPVRVELAGTWSRGRTIVDRRDWSDDLPHDPHGRARSTIDVCLAVDAQRYSTLWFETVTGGLR
jgi:pyrimidine-specific ribonucleoside hydrolase